MDASKRLIPYSVHLTPEIYEKLKELAQERKASKLVRDAITMILSGKDEFNSGYNKAIRDTIDLVQHDEYFTMIGINGDTIAELLVEKLEMMLK